jgi:hypothetical protein
MNRMARFRRLATTLVVSGGLSLAGVALGAGTAHADPQVGVCNGMACSYVWCPGMPLPEPRYGPPDWDMNVCHHYMIGKITPGGPAWTTNGGQNRQVSPMLIEGDPGPCQGCVS